MSDVWQRIGWTDPDRRDEALERLVQHMNNTPTDPYGDKPLSPVEFRIVTALSYGVGDKGAAALCDVSYHTARSHIKHAQAKLRAKNSVHMVAKALRQGIIT